MDLSMHGQFYGYPCMDSVHRGPWTTFHAWTINCPCMDTVHMDSVHMSAVQKEKSLKAIIPLKLAIGWTILLGRL